MVVKGLSSFLKQENMILAAANFWIVMYKKSNFVKYFEKSKQKNE